MRCSKARKLISPYIDGELDAGIKPDFEGHIAGCGGCERELRETRSLHNLFAGAEKVGAPFGFSTRVMANVRAADRITARAKVPLFVRFAEAVVVLVMVAAGILAGGSLVNTSSPAGPGVASTFSLEVFDAAPPDSLGSAYLAMMEVQGER